MFKGMVFGSMPRTKRIARALSRYQQGKIDREQLDQIYRRELKNLLDLVSSARLSRSSDGMYRWDDLFNPLSSYMGIEVNGLKRFYDNNFFFRQPVFSRAISYGDSVVCANLVEDLKSLGYADRVEAVSLSLPGPLTLVANSLVVGNAYTSRESLARDYIEKVVLAEAERCSREGVKHLDIHEPELAFVTVPDEFIDLYKRVSELFKGSIWITIYFGYNSENLKKIGRISRDVRIIPVVDLVSSKLLDREAIEKVGKDLDNLREVGLGIIDSRNTRMESVEELKRFLEEFAKTLRNAENIYVTHNTNLEFLPEKIAVEKIKLIGRLATGL